jgi:signal transduction histidine kinase
MELENKACEAIAKALRAISKETSYRGLADALLAAALGYCEGLRGAVMLTEGGEQFKKANLGFPRERSEVIVSHPPVSKFQLPAKLRERVLRRQETVVEHHTWKGSAFIDRTGDSAGPEITILCLPLIHLEETIGVLYLESDRYREVFTSKCVSLMSILASQAAVSFESAQIFEALRETNLWMVKGQEICRTGSYWYNTRTLLSRLSHELYRIFDVDLSVNPVPFEVLKARVHPDDFPALERAIAEAVSTRSPFNQEYRIVHKDGTTLQVVAIGQVEVGPSGDVELQGIISDVTKQKASEQAVTDAQAELARAARLASLGELAGSIVHEVNQPLTGITMSAEACLRWLDRDPADLSEARKSAIRVIDQARRASEVVGGLKSLVRNAGLHFTAVQINQAIEEVLLLSKRELERAGVTLKTEFDKSMPAIEADRVQIQQVVLNLVRNAIDAMSVVNGRPRVLTSATKVTDGHALVTITDTGVGVDAASSERLFEALYTTKREGLGLGLSICRKIITAHGGRLWVETNARYGTAFTFILPVRQSIESFENN